MTHLQAIQTPRRFQHSLGVMGVMDELASVYGFDRQQARLAGLLHDAAKDFSPAQQLQALRDSGIQPRCEAERDFVVYMHGAVGAYYVREALGVTDELVLDAIATHCFMDGGAYFHHPLSWCLRFADVLEPYRVWEGPARALAQGTPGVREAAFAGRLEEAARRHVRMVLRFYGENDIPVHPNFQRVLAELETGLLDLAGG